MKQSIKLKEIPRDGVNWCIEIACEIATLNLTNLYRLEVGTKKS